MEKHGFISEIIDENTDSVFFGISEEEFEALPKETVFAELLKFVYDQPGVFELLSDNLPYIDRSLWLDGIILALQGDRMRLLQFFSTHFDYGLDDEDYAIFNGK